MATYDWFCADGSHIVNNYFIISGAKPIFTAENRNNETMSQGNSTESESSSAVPVGKSGPKDSSVSGKLEPGNIDRKDSREDEETEGEEPGSGSTDSTESPTENTQNQEKGSAGQPAQNEIKETTEEPESKEMGTTESTRQQGRGPTSRIMSKF